MSGQGTKTTPSASVDRTGESTVVDAYHRPGGAGNASSQTFVIIGSAGAHQFEVHRGEPLDLVAQRLHEFADRLWISGRAE